jgi:uncharacterized membrane protein
MINFPPTTDIPLWLKYGQAIALIALPMVGAWIAWEQMQIARAKLKNDLYDRRFKVYDATMELLSHALTHGRVSDEALHKFALQTAESTFLFEEEVILFLKEIRTNASNVWVFGGTLQQGGLSAADRANYAKMVGNALGTLNAKIDQIQSVFRPYLGLYKK